MESVLVELDARRRAALGKVGLPEHRRYEATTEPDGTVVLRPVELVTPLQRRLEQSARVQAAFNPDAMDRSTWVQRKN